MGSACSYFDTTGGGLALDPATGVLSGTPMVLTAQAPYVVTAENARGRASVTLSLAVDAPSSAGGNRVAGNANGSAATTAAIALQ
jgi:hypothetical protein